MTTNNLNLIAAIVFSFLIGWQHDKFILPVVGFVASRFFEVVSISAFFTFIIYCVAFTIINSQKKGRD